MYKIVVPRLLNTSFTENVYQIDESGKQPQYYVSILKEMNFVAFHFDAVFFVLHVPLS